MDKKLVVIRSGGDIGTAIAHKLRRCGFPTIVVENDKPLAIRRTVVFAQAIYDGQITVDGVKAVYIKKSDEQNYLHEIDQTIQKGDIPVLIDPECNIIKKRQVEIVIDAILTKKNLGMTKDMASITIGVGPGFEAGKDVDVVIESNRGHYLGQLIFKGYAQLNTSVPTKIMGLGKERVIHSPIDGTIKNIEKIGNYVNIDQTIAIINELYNKEKILIKATINGVLRGLIMDGIEVRKGLKIADIDPRGVKEYCYTISDKGRTIAGGVLEAILSAHIWRDS